VDDDPEILSLLKRGLAYEGYTVVTAGSGTEALHVDYLKQISWGPVSGHEEFLVFAEGQFVARGGYRAGAMGGPRNWPLVVERGNWLVPFRSPTGAEPLALPSPTPCVAKTLR